MRALFISVCIISFNFLVVFLSSSGFLIELTLLSNCQMGQCLKVFGRAVVFVSLCIFLFPLYNRQAFSSILGGIFPVLWLFPLCMSVHGGRVVFLYREPVFLLVGVEETFQIGFVVMKLALCSQI